MSPAAAALLSVIGVLVWVGLGLLVTIAIGRSIREADRQEAARREAERSHHAGAAKACCPHPPEQAPETVRGEFRAVVVPSYRVPAEPAKRLDVYL